MDSRKIAVGTTIAVGSLAAFFWLRSRRKPFPPSSNHILPSTSASSHPTPNPAPLSALSPVHQTEQSKPQSKAPQRQTEEEKEKEEEESQTQELVVPNLGPNMSWSEAVEKEAATLHNHDEGLASTNSSSLPLNANPTPQQISPASSNGVKHAHSPFAPSDLHSEVTNTPALPTHLDPLPFPHCFVSHSQTDVTADQRKRGWVYLVISSRGSELIAE